MSNKNLRSYRIQFIAEVGDMIFPVKFPCQVKMIWKRSSETASTSLVQVQNGVVHFNQTIKLYANMHLDTITNKFVEKKCLFSFLIVTPKGEKSAGHFTYDLAQFFNNRVYELQQDFTLQKCPLKETKIHLKIYYQESTETGYDSMSRISTSSQLDISTASVDTANFNENEQHSQNNEESKSKTSGSETTTKEVSEQKEDDNQNLDLLNESDLGGNVNVNNDEQNSEKIAQNIQALNKITGKINDFVSRCSGNIKSEIDNLKLKNNSLEQSLTTIKVEKERLQKQNDDKTLIIDGLRKQLNDTKVDLELKIKKESEKAEEVAQKYEQSQKLCSQLEKSMEEKGQSQSSYIGELKSNFEQNESTYKEKIQNLNEELAQKKKENSDLNSLVSKWQSAVNQLKEKLYEAQEKNKNYQEREIRREKELSELRYKIENVYEEIVKNLGNIVQ